MAAQSLALTDRQRTRLAALLAYARERSPACRERYQDVPLPPDDLTRLPVVRKPDLMAHFADGLTDPALTQAGVDAFLADPANVGRLYRGRYAIWTTSGTTGVPGAFVHDHRALSIYVLLITRRAYPIWLGPSGLWDLLRSGMRYAFILATGGHFAGVSFWERLRRKAGPRAASMHTISALAPLDEIVAELNTIQPVVVAGYPSGLALLAGEQTAGRLQIRPLLMTTAGEWVDEATRAAIAAAFPASRLYDIYGTTEFPYVAFGCREGWLHVNSDWAILEPVDEAYQPVPPGQPSQTVLLTNLANRAQPLIRYELSDRVTLKPEPCPCGSRLPAVRVEGRRDDVLHFSGVDGGVVAVLPLAIATVVELAPGVRRCQLIQTGAADLSLRLEVEPGCDPAQAWEGVRRRLEAYLEAQGARGVAIRQDPEPPHADPASGKYRQVWSAVRAGEQPFGN